MKKYLSMFLAFALLLMMIPVFGVSATENKTGQWNSRGIMWEYDAETKTLTLKGTGSSTLDDEFAPSPVEEFKTEIEHVVCEEGIINVGSSAFKNWTSLKTVEAPGAVTIKDMAFYNDTNLSSVTFSDELIKIDVMAFANTGLTEITVPASCERIYEFAFDVCEKLTSVTILGKTTGVNFRQTELEDTSGNTLGLADTVTVHLYKDSYAEIYCQRWGYTYDYLSETEPIPDPEPTTDPEPIPDPDPDPDPDPEPDPVPAMPFTDVSEKDWFYDEVAFAYQNNLFNGTTETTFEPKTVMTRAMLVTVLYRLDGSEAVEFQPLFEDVAEKAWYADAVIWAAKHEIVNGVGNNRFAPDEEVTREQIATIVARYADYKGFYEEKTADLSVFPDGAKTSDWAKSAMEWAISVKLINGSDNKLLPQDGATRAQVAAILMRFIQNIMPD